MSDTPQPKREASDAEIEQLLVSNLSTPPLSPEATERVRAAVSQAWEATTSPAQTHETRGHARHWGRWLGLTATSLVAIAFIFFAIKPVAEQDVIGSLARTSDGGIERTQGLIWHHALKVGDPLRVGETLTARSPALVALAEGGTLRLAGNSVIAVEAASQLSLEHGKLYVDKPVGVIASHPLRVATRVGLVEPLGTEFEVLSNDQVVRIRVREGQVRFSGATGVLVATVGTELLASSGGQVTQRPVPTFGNDWQWTAALAPDFAVEGRSLSDYLQWISRELGRPLVYANAQARESAQRTILHGSVRSEATLDALAEVLSSTSLTYELADGAIGVHFTR